MLGAPAADGGGDTEADAALLGELERIREQVLQHLLQPLGVGDDAAARDADRCRRRTTAGGCPPRAGTAAPTVSSRLRERDLLGIDRDRAGLDLRQVEDVADEVEQVGAGAVNGAGELDLLGGQVAVRVVGQLLAEDQDAVERRAQLVATCWRGIRTCTSRSAPARWPFPRARGGPARFPGSCARPRRCARRAAAPSARAARWSAAVPSAASAVRRRAAATASAGLRSASSPRSS